MARAAARLVVIAALHGCFAFLGEGAIGCDAAQRPLRTRESAHFVVHTDAPLEVADESLQRMEDSLQFAIRHWRKETQEPIECYLVDDLSNWPAGSLPHPLARIFVRHVGGATLDRTSDNGGVHNGRVVIYASTVPGVVEHEVIHAYCSVVFGSSGPEWFREGMAEMASYQEHVRSGVRCPNVRLAELRRVQVRAVQDVRSVGRSTKRLTNSLSNMMARRRTGEHHVNLAAWTDQDSHVLKQARDEYLWSWALCHLLYHNPNYSDRFRILGDGYVSRKRVTFEQAFFPRHRELMFEYAQFVQHAQVGYRADLCHWDWDQRFVSVNEGSDIHCLCKAARGWQPSGLDVTKDVAYSFRSRGQWSHAPHSQTDANGSANGRGQLTAVIMRDFELSAPFPLGVEGEFVAPMGGKLYLRCADDWQAIHDNVGVQLVQFSLARSKISATGHEHPRPLRGVAHVPSHANAAARLDSHHGARD